MGRFIRFLAFADMRQATIGTGVYFGLWLLARLFFEKDSFFDALIFATTMGIEWFFILVIMSARRNKRKEEHRKNIESIKKINPSKSRARSFCERDGDILRATAALIGG